MLPILYYSADNLTNSDDLDKLDEFNSSQSMSASMNQFNSDSLESNSFKMNTSDNDDVIDRLSINSRIQTSIGTSTAVAATTNAENNKYNISNVLKQVYTLMQRNSDPESSREFWMPDDQVKECFECNEKFTTFRRRHVCLCVNVLFLDSFIKNI